MIRSGRIFSAAAIFLAACGGPLSPRLPVVCKDAPRAPEPILPTRCGPTADYTPVNSYQGDLGAIQAREDAVVLINGNCTGTLIAAAAGPVVLTAGHCAGLGDRILAVFNFEEAADGDPLITEGTVIAQATAPDYALIQLDTLPAVTPTPLALDPGDRLAIIQHPRGRPKVVAEGAFLDSCNGLLYYSNDTDVGSSGAGILNRQGSLVGIHTAGDCDTGGTNYGWTAAAIVASSDYLQDSDLAER